ncbi:MAG: glycosyltransferase family 39 protein [Candidatus Omnitrophica bacterium]|nr:glycosyltransferase family 39 protein [Candidatus Omnitrophota bacterium]
MNKKTFSGSNGVVLIFLLLILISGYFFRCYSAKDRGLFHYDEGLYFSETRFLNEGFRYIMINGLDKAIDFGRLKSETNGIPLITGKPGYNLVLFLFSLAAGVNDRTLILVSVMFGIINIFLIFLITQHLYNKWLGLISASLAAVSSYHIYYSTIALPEMVGAVFFLIGFYCYLLSIQRRGVLFLALSGFAVGYAFTCNQWRWVFLPLSIVFFDFLRLTMHKINFYNLVKRNFVFISFCLIPIVSFQAPYKILLLVNKYLPFRTYFQQLSERLAAGEPMVFSFQNSWVFLKYFWIIEGPILSLILFYGIIRLAIDVFKKNKEADIYIFLITILPFLAFSLLTYSGENLSRTVSISLFFSSIIIARLFMNVKNIRVIYLLVLLILSYGFFNVYKKPHLYSGYKEAASYINKRGYTSIFVLDNEAVFRAYAGRIAYKPYERPANLAELMKMTKQAGIKILVVDYNVLYSKYGQGFIGEITNSLKPEAVFENTLSNSYVHLTDLYNHKTINKIISDPRTRFIKIYNIECLMAF